jgi:hypothetical protein
MGDWSGLALEDENVAASLAAICDGYKAWPPLGSG